jgi:hypothetical protein
VTRWTHRLKPISTRGGGAAETTFDKAMCGGGAAETPCDKAMCGGGAAETTCDKAMCAQCCARTCTRRAVARPTAAHGTLLVLQRVAAC